MDSSGVQSSSGSNRSPRRSAPVVWAAMLCALLPGARAGAYAEGDVLITEIMVVADSRYDEWFELQATTDDVSLDGCVILNGTSDVMPADPSNPGTGWTDYPIEDADLVLDEGQFAVLARVTESNTDPCVAYSDATLTDCLVEADATYGSVEFNNSASEYLMIACDNGGGSWVRLDSAPAYWTTELEQGCSDDACSATLDPNYYDEEGNDDVGNWCAARSQDPFIARSGGASRGTPGVLGKCIPDNVVWPAVGEVVFSEVMVNPARAYSAEWFELSNATAQVLFLDACKVRIEKIEDGSSTIIMLPDGLPVDAHGQALFASECIDWVSGDDDSAAGECAFGEILDGGIGFSDGKDYELELSCPDGTSGDYRTIDVVEFNDEVQGIREGHSMMFVPADHGNPETANDDRDNWCEAAYSQCFLDEDGVDCEYGTPGQLNDCLTDFVDWPDNGPACRCVLSRGPVAPTLAAVALGLAGLLGLRRRR